MVAPFRFGVKRKEEGAGIGVRIREAEIAAEAADVAHTNVRDPPLHCGQSGQVLENDGR